MSDFTNNQICYRYDIMWIKCKNNSKDSGAENVGLPVFVKSFAAQKNLQRCELCVTATGIFSVNINGYEIPDRFMPGWSNYKKHIDLCDYDLTQYIVSGENELKITVANGWYSGKLGYGNKIDVFGDEKRLFAELTLFYADGSTEKITTDESWEITSSDVIFADFFDGETIDARRRGNAKNNQIAQNPAETAEKSDFTVPLRPYNREPARVIARIEPQIIYADDKIVRYDFGYNFAGVIKITAKGKSGDKIIAKYGETLCENGSVYTANLRRAKCTDEFILSGGEDTFEPKFTFHGFRFAELQKPAGAEITAAQGLAISQDIEYYGSFECSNEVINGVYEMALRGQKSNFISIPTDCPQRDERLGWTGDAEVFCNSAMFNANCNLFFKNYLSLVREDAFPDGKIPSIVPFYMGLSDNTAGVPGWGDCITVMPYFHYLHYRDPSILADNLPSAKKWIGYYLSKSENYLTKITNNFGDWLSVNGDTNPNVVNQCFFGYSALLTAKICDILKQTEKSKRYCEIYENCKRAFRENYYKNGRIASDTQTAYAFAYAAGYLSKEETAARLPEKIRENGGGLTTGFIGSRFILPALSDIGETDTAYEIISRTAYPSWGYMLQNGATTVWERWNGYTKENGFEDPEMNSFNHYSLGSCVEWLYSYVLGIKLSAENDTVKISPSFGKKIAFARGGTRVKGGKIFVSWKRENGAIMLEVKADEGVNYEIASSGEIMSVAKNGNDTVAVVNV